MLRFALHICVYIINKKLIFSLCSSYLFFIFTHFHDFKSVSKGSVCVYLSK